MKIKEQWLGQLSLKFNTPTILKMEERFVQPTTMVNTKFEVLNFIKYIFTFFLIMIVKVITFQKLIICGYYIFVIILRPE